MLLAAANGNAANFWRAASHRFAGELKYHAMTSLQKTYVVSLVWRDECDPQPTENCLRRFTTLADGTISWRHTRGNKVLT
jgi:hypothetical protein